MKKLLSMVLALAMILSLIPAAFAAEGETGAQEYSGITVKYDFTKFEGAVDKADAKEIVSSYDKSYGLWKYSTSGHTRAVPLKQVTDQKTGSFALCVNYGTNNTIDNDAKGTTSTAEKDFYFAYEIYVSKSGKYDIILENMQSGSCGADAQVFIFPASESFTYTTLTSEWSSDEKGHRQGGVFSYCNKTLGDSKFISTYVDLEDRYFDKGSYVVVFAAVEAQAGDGLTYANRYMGPMKLILDGDGETEEKFIPMSMLTSVDNQELMLGETETAKMTADVYMSDGNKNTTCDITYTSSNDNIAKVDEEGNITAVGYGAATITATATIGDYTVSGEEEITVENPNGVKIAYKVASLATGNDGYLTYLTKDNTNGFYRYYGMATTSATDPSKTGGHLAITVENIRLHSYSALAFEVYVPKSDYYTMEMSYACLNNGGRAGIFLGKADELELVYTEHELGEKIGNYECHANGAGKVSIPGIWIEQGWNTISFSGDNPATLPDGWGSFIYINDFTLASGTGTAPMPGMIRMGADELKVGGTTTAEAIKYLSDGNPAEGATISDITSSDSGVVTVDEDGNVVAKGAGKATLSATVTYNGTPEAVTREVTVVDIGADKTITIAVDDNGDGKASVDSSKAVGDSYTVTAADRSSENLEFRGWVRGSAENGTWVSNENPYTFTVTTNTYLTAVYSAVATEENPVTEYYNWNGAYLGTEEVEPTLTGYSFREWVITKVSDFLSRAVAQYNVENTEYNVTTDNSFDISVEGGKYVYDAKVTCEATDDVYWYRDGKCVDYGTTYIFNVWGDTKITTSATGSNGAKVMLDEVEKTTGTTEKTYMIEYDKGDKNIIEVGILFGQNATPTIEVCDQKMTSQRNSDHGQFSATSAYSNTRGYLIYNDNGTYRVIYAD
ncbi:MAG: hypothetical protein E7441_04355 [Ruminococcaceae bacterium]|nr:hypothetical protein [Oscillospiraceae bacterium]